ncbi:MAG: rhombosortase [Planctomycetes bacterium]|nr:rhombosortase [Planctomycetota bacterium]
MKRWETWIYAACILVANIGLVTGTVATWGYYYPDRVIAGEFYRLLTHPFVHVSGYHLLLDGSAFLMLYAMLRESSLVRRTIYLLGTHIGCVIGVTLALPLHESIGYAGLSGIAHGLMAIWALECLQSKERDTVIVGWITFGVVLGKALYEALSSQMLFSFMHNSLIGQPISVSHLSGILGGVLSFGLLRCRGSWLCVRPMDGDCRGMGLIPKAQAQQDGT